jgi:branched-subunit amino acid transport protein AzlD
MTQLNDTQTILIIITMSVVTMLLRSLPFLLFKAGKVPAYIDYLGRVLPYAVMAMLVVYCMKGVDLLIYPHGIPELIAGILTAVIFIISKNTLLSIIPGTICYMVLIQIVFK